MMVVTSWESWTLVPSVASLLEELLLLGQVVPTLCFMGRASDKGSLTRGQVLGSFTSYSSHPLPNPQPSPACAISSDAKGLLCPEQLRHS